MPEPLFAHDTKYTFSVLHIGKYFPPFAGGMENFLADLLKASIDKGIRVSAIVHDHRRRLRSGTSQSQPAGFAQEYSPATGYESAAIYRVPELGSLLYVPLSPQFPFWLRRAIRAERPDILHLHLPNTSAFWALCVPEARAIPWVVHWQSDVVSSDLDRRLRFAYPFYKPFEQAVLDRAEKVIVTSPPYLGGSDALRPWRVKCRIVPLGVDPTRIFKASPDDRSVAEQYWSGADFRILSVGRLTYYKGHEHLISAMQQFTEGCAVIVGEGVRRTILENTISELGVHHRVVLAGSLPPQQLHALMETCDCMCLPSIERTEAFGMVLLEGMAHRKPSVVSDVYGSGVGWVIQHGRTGLLVPPADPSALAEAFRRLYADRASLSRMGRQGWERYQSMFRIERVSREILEVYKEILRTKDPD